MKALVKRVKVPHLELFFNERFYFFLACIRNRTGIRKNTMTEKALTGWNDIGTPPSSPNPRADRLPGFPLWKHVALVGKGQNLAASWESDYKHWHMEEQIVPHLVHQVCAIFMDGKKRGGHDGCVKVVTGPKPGDVTLLSASTVFFRKPLLLLQTCTLPSGTNDWLTERRRTSTWHFTNLFYLSLKIIES